AYLAVWQHLAPLNWAVVHFLCILVARLGLTIAWAEVVIRLLRLAFDQERPALERTSFDIFVDGLGGGVGAGLIRPRRLTGAGRRQEGCEQEGREMAGG